MLVESLDFDNHIAIDVRELGAQLVARKPLSRHISGGARSHAVGNNTGQRREVAK
jgi:hypothetical protein